MQDFNLDELECRKSFKEEFPELPNRTKDSGANLLYKYLETKEAREEKNGIFS